METNNSPRVLMVVPQYPFPVVGGLERQAHMLASRLANAGGQILVVSGKITNDHPATETSGGVSVHRLIWSQHRLVRFAVMPWLLFSLMRKLRDHYDIVHVHQYSWFSLFSILTAKLLGKKTLAKMSNIGKQGIPGIKARATGWLQLKILFLVDGIVAMSNESVRELTAASFPRNRILTVPNGVRLPTTETDSQEDSRECRVVFMGRLVEQKGLRYLLKAWRMVADTTKTPARLELWGNGPLKDELIALGNQLALGDTLVFKGHVDNASEKIASAGIFVLPSQIEGNSNAVLEAMAASLPIVATQVSGTEMQVGEQGQPFLSSYGDIQALAANLSTLIDDPQMRRNLGKSMRDRVEKEFSIDHIPSVYQKAYQLLMKGMSESLHTLNELPE